MKRPKPKCVVYNRANFIGTLRSDYLYQATHLWAAARRNGAWRIGLTRLGVRLLGEIVELSFSAEPGQIVRRGQYLGWIEGFKCINDIVSFGGGTFAGVNPALRRTITLINREPYDAGWLYQLIPSRSLRGLGIAGYTKVMDKVINRIARERGVT